jgi:hypothetical protein
MSADTEKAKSALFEFLSAMKDWENKFATLFKPEHGGPEGHGAEAETEVRPIYEKYLATVKTERLALSAGYPPKFDPDAERIVSTESSNTNKVVIETLWTHPRVPDFTEQHRYTMTNKGGEWRLDKREFYDSGRNKWVKQTQ